MENTRIIKINPASPEISAILEAASVLKSGGIIGLPTDTVYGLGADAGNEEALQELYMIKAREPGKPTSILIHSRNQLGALVSEITGPAEFLMETFWPGPLTIIFKASAKVHSILSAGGGTIGIRIPDSPVCLGILRETGFPLTAPSANVSGRPPACSAQEVFESFNGRIKLILDGGEADSSSPSTIADATGADIKIIREGKISKAVVEKVLAER